MDIVSEVLERAARKAEKYKTTEVEKNLPLELDLGNLLAIDNNDLDMKKFKANTDAYLLSLARDNTQLLVNQLWELPAERVEEAIVVTLPEPTTVLPREKPVPKPKAPSKWEKYAQEKGIRKRKKDKLVWDEVVQKWIPRYGYRRAEVEHDKDWVLEVPQNADPMEDQFTKKTDNKSERVAKNEVQRLRNLAASRKVKLPKVAPPTENASANQLSAALNLTKKSTASLGVFQDKLPKEKPAKGTGRKRKFEPLLRNSVKEKKSNLSILDRILTKKPKLDVDRAVNKQIFEENKERTIEKRSMKGKGGKGKKKAGRGGALSGKKQGKRNNFSKKNVGGKRNRNTVKRGVGKK